MLCVNRIASSTDMLLSLAQFLNILMATSRSEVADPVNLSSVVNLLEKESPTRPVSLVAAVV
jgi:hypothetical protein